MTSFIEIGTSLRVAVTFILDSTECINSIVSVPRIVLKFIFVIAHHN